MRELISSGQVPSRWTVSCVPKRNEGKVFRTVWKECTRSIKRDGVNRADSVSRKPRRFCRNFANSVLVGGVDVATKTTNVPIRKDPGERSDDETRFRATAAGAMIEGGSNSLGRLKKSRDINSNRRARGQALACKSLSLDYGPAR